MGKAINLTVGSPVKHGQNITVNCNANYELASNSTPIVCNNGTWTQIPKCEPARCKSLPAPPLNGMVVVSQKLKLCQSVYQKAEEVCRKLRKYEKFSQKLRT
jgi:hypothetical protein